MSVPSGETIERGSTFSRPEFQDAIPFWPDTCFLLLGLGTSTVALGLLFGILAVVPLSMAGTVITCALFAICHFSIFRFFRLSNFVIYFVVSVISALTIFVTGHLYAYWATHLPLIIGAHSITPNNLIDFAVLPFTTKNPWLILQYPWELTTWIAQGAVLGAISTLSPLLVCVMYAEAED